MAIVKLNKNISAITNLFSSCSCKLSSMISLMADNITCNTSGSKQIFIKLSQAVMHLTLLYIVQVW